MGAETSGASANLPQVRVSGLGSRTIADTAAVPGAPLPPLHIDTMVGSVKICRR